MARVSLLHTSPSPDMGTIRECLQNGLELLGGIHAFVRRGARVVLKPNVGSVAAPQEARNTDPRLIEALIQLLQEFGVGEIVIAESAIVGFDTQVAFRAMGLDRLAHRYRVQLCDLKQQPFVTRKVRHPFVLPEIEVSGFLDEVDTLINLPKLKTISAVPVSFGLKNLKGLISDGEKRRFHNRGLPKALGDLGQVVTPQLTIVDGIVASELYEPREANLIVIGSDVLAVDAVAAAAIGLVPAEVEYFRLAHEAGMGPIDLDEIEVVGAALAETRVFLRTAPTESEAFSMLFPEVAILDGEACSGCIGSLYMGLKTARARGLLDSAPALKLVVGPGVKELPPGKQVLCLGNCTKPLAAAHFLPGCPFISIEFCALLHKAFLDQ